MSVVGIGVDLVDIQRIRRLRGGGLRHVFDESERPESLTDEVMAQAFAGKEAVAKALGTGFWQAGVAFTDVRLGPDLQLRLSGRAAAIASSDRFSLSFSWQGSVAMAVAFRLKG